MHSDYSEAEAAAFRGARAALGYVNINKIRALCSHSDGFLRAVATDVCDSYDRMGALYDDPALD